jgi:Flp pilus assembly pilin Flp
MRYFFKKWLRETGGATAIEYSLIAAGISLAITTFIFIFGQDLSDVFEGLAGALDGNA